MTKCDERVYRGSQYNRIVGRPCKGEATTIVVSGESQLAVCKQHAKSLGRRGYKVAAQ